MSQATAFDRTTILPDIETLTGDIGGAVGPSAGGDINIQGGSNINTAGFPGANQLQINLDDTVNIIGSMTAGTGFVATTGGVQVIDGDVTLSSGRVLLPDTSAGFLDGTINFGGDVYLHNFGVDNFFVGPNSGNDTLTGTDNFNIGSNSLENLTSGSHNVAFGNNVLNAVTSGGYNTAMAPSALASLTAGNYNTVYGREGGAFLVNGISNLILGYQAGIHYTTNESSNILLGSRGVLGEDNTIHIGWTGAGSHQQNRAFLAGTYGVTPAGATQQVVMDANEQLGTAGAFVVTGTGQTVGAVTDDVVTIALGAVPLTASLDVTVAAFEATTPAGAFYKLWNGARTTGAAAALTGTTDNVVNEEAALLAADADIIVNANNVIVRVTGVALLTIEWTVTVNYITAS